MRALILDEDGPCLTGGRPDPALADGDEVIVRIRRAAICRTDLHVARRRLPARTGIVLGHEIAGEIAEVGTAAGTLRVGQHVFVNPLAPCGRCRECSDGADHLCADARFMGLHFDGGFSELVRVTADRVHALDPDLPFECGAYIEPVAAALAPLSFLPPGGRVGVFGDNRIAQLTLHLLADRGYDAKPAIPGTGAAFPVVIETTLGDASPAAPLLSCLENGGLLVLKSRPAEPVAFPVAEMVRRRLRVQAASYGPFADAIDFAHRHADVLLRMVGETWRLEDHVEAFDAAEQSEDSKQFFAI